MAQDLVVPHKAMVSKAMISQQVVLPAQHLVVGLAAVTGGRVVATAVVAKVEVVEVTVVREVPAMEAVVVVVVVVAMAAKVGVILVEEVSNGICG